MSWERLLLTCSCAIERQSAPKIIVLPKKLRDQVQYAAMTYQAIDRIFYLLTGLSFALGLALALSLLLG